jgi:hypothetical protein
MSVQALAVVNDCARSLSDPQFQRVTRADWRAFMNEACRDLARKLRLVKWTATFDIENEGEYAMPEDCVQLVKVFYNPTPADRDTWRVLGEKFADEFYDATDGAYAEGDPCEYFADTDTFHLYPRPDTAITGGGKVTYWGMPDEVTDEGVQLMPLRDVLRDSLAQRMLVLALRHIERFDKADEYEKEWLASLTTDRDRLEDRSQDRRPRMRPGGISFGER